jgi:thiol-disulfide isomerase/thioredoxin
MNKLILYVILLFPLITLGQKNDITSKYSSVTIELKVEDYKNEKYIIGYPFEKDTIDIDERGIGKIVLPLKSMTFACLNRYKPNAIALFLEPGNHLLITIKNGEVSFKGKGANINNYRYKSEQIIKQFKDSIVKIRRGDYTFEKYMEVCGFYKTKHQIFHSEYVDEIPLSKKIEYIFQSNTQANFLLEKQYYLQGYSIHESDSLDLEKKLEFDIIDIFKDTLLINLKSSALPNLIMHHSERIIMKKLPILEFKEKNDIAMFPAYSLDSLKELTIYSSQIKGQALYSNLSMFISSFGSTIIIDSLIKDFENEYPSMNKKLKHIKKMQKEFNPLSPRKPAPFFEFTSSKGKVFTEQDLKGKIVFIDVWATWCVPCREGHPYVAKLIEKFKNDNIVFLFISHDSNKIQWETYLAMHPELKGIHVFGKNKKFSTDYKITGIPRYIIIDKKSNIVNAFARSPEKEIGPILEELLLEKIKLPND